MEHQCHKKRIITVTRKELKLFAKIFDDNDEYESARLPSLHASTMIDVLHCFASQERILGKNNEIYQDFMWNETYAQEDHTIKRDTHFPDNLAGLICAGPHISVANPMFKTPRRICKEKADFDRIYLDFVDQKYLPRSNYRMECSIDEYVSRCSTTTWNNKTIENYRIFCRKMLNLKQERTLMGAIYPPKVGHTNAVTSFSFKNLYELALMASVFASIPFDFFIKVLGKSNLHADNAGKLPIPDSVYNSELVIRGLRLNCVSAHYEQLWSYCWNDNFVSYTWASNDSRLAKYGYGNLSAENMGNALIRSDYARRQALVEIDVLTAMALGMTLEQLTSIYKIQFPVLQAYETDTWYDSNGQIVFTNNRGLSGVGFSRTEWENGIKGAPAGKRFYRTITDDTMPGGPVERTIEYVAPFDRCDREQDYETAWKFFEEKYGGGER